MATLVDEARPLSKQEHQCCACDATIRAGVRYVRQRIVDGRDAWTWKAHLECQAAADSLDLFDDEVWDPVAFIEELERSPSTPGAGIILARWRRHIEDEGA